MENNKTHFCTECRQYTRYTLHTKNITRNINNKEYAFQITTAICDQCGNEMGIPGIIDKNVQEVEEQYQIYKKQN